MYLPQFLQKDPQGAESCFHIMEKHWHKKLCPTLPPIETLGQANL